VISDVEMPVLDGPAMIYRMFVEDLGRENIPVILISGAPGLPKVVAALGTPYSLAKPFSVSALSNVLDRALAEARPPHPASNAAVVEA
jgi:DNA-binding NtrC family response regulator